MSYFLAPALVRLRAEINAAYPKRDHTSDGWIGDVSHAARKSDHNPDYSDGGVVRAIDVDKDGIDPEHLVAVAIKDPRTQYVIWAGHIWSRSVGFVRHVYTGTNGHYHHVHISIRHDAKLEKDTSSWRFAAAKPVAKIPAKPHTAPTSPGKKVRPNCTALQKALRATADNLWGDGTDKNGNAVRWANSGRFPSGVEYAQKVVGAHQDGHWGPDSIKAMHATMKAVQTALRGMGFDPGPSDGNWGTRTESAYLHAREACHH